MISDRYSLTLILIAFAFFGMRNNISAQCTTSHTSGSILSFGSCNSWSSINPANVNSAYRFTVVNGGLYEFETCGTGFNSMMTLRQTSGTGTLISFNNGGQCSDDVSIGWTGTFNGTLAVIVKADGCAWSGTGSTGTSAVIRYRQRNPNAGSTSIQAYNCTSYSLQTSGGEGSRQWQQSPNNSTWSDISGATSTSYTVSSSNTNSYFRVKHTAGNCESYTNSVYVVPRTFTGNFTVTQSTTMAGTYNINGDFTINSGVTVTVADGCELNVMADNVDISGIINATGTGNAGGANGSAGTGSSNLGCNTDPDWNSSTSPGNSGGNGGGGANSGTNGGAGYGCGQDCGTFDDYAGLVKGAGGAGGGAGGSYGGNGGDGGNGGTSGGYSTSGSILTNLPYCSNSYSGGAGGAGGAAAGAFGSASNLSIDFGTGGAGAGGGGRGASNGASGGSGGRGGGKITIISRDNPSSPYTFALSGAIYANGDNGGAGGGGGNAGRTVSNCCGDPCNQENVEEAVNVSGAGGGGGAGGGSGGGVMLIAHGNANIVGTIEAKGGNGGDGGDGGNSSTSSYGGGGLCGSSRSITNFGGGDGENGGKGGGGRIKIFYNDCANATISPNYNINAGSSGNGTAGNGSYYVGVHPDHTPLVAGSIIGNQNICEGQTPGTLSNQVVASGGTGIYSYTWLRCTSGCGSPPTNYSAAPGTNNGVNYTPTGAYNTTTWFVRRVTSGTCTEYTGFVVVTVNEPSTVEAGGPNTVCQSSSPSAITLSGASVGGGATTGTWSIINGGGTLSNTSATSNPAGVTYTPATNFSGTVTLRLTTNAAAGCSNVIDDRIINVTALPIASASNTGPYCTGQTISLSTPAVTGATYAWSGPGGFTSSSRTPTRSSATTAMSGTYTVTVTANGCSNVSSTVVTVNQASTVEAGGPNTVCESPSPTAITLTGASIGGGATTGTWSIISGGGSLSNTGATSNPAGVTYTPAANFSGTVTLRLTSNALASCSNVTDDRTINVTALPVSTASNTGSYCVGETISLSTPAVTGATYSWSGPAGFTSSSRTPTRSNATTAMAGSYTVTVTANGCSRASSTTVVVYTNPTVSVSPSSTTICTGGNVTLTANPVAGSGNGTFTYIWSGGGTGNTKNVTSAGTYTVTVTEGVSGCTASGSATVAVVADPAVTITTPTQTICKGNSITLSSNITNPGTGSCSRQWQSRPVGGSTWTDLGTAATQGSGAITQNTEFRVNYNCSGSGCGAATSNIVTISFTDDNTWTGAAGSAGVGDWHNPANWSCGLVPTTTTDVLIPGTATAPNQPVIYGGFTGVCNTINLTDSSNLTIQSNGELQVNPQIIKKIEGKNFYKASNLFGGLVVYTTPVLE